MGGGAWRAFDAGGVYNRGFALETLVGWREGPAWSGLSFGMRRVEVLEGAGEAVAADREGDSAVEL